MCVCVAPNFNSESLLEYGFYKMNDNKNGWEWQKNERNY